jgi:type IV fimbrial biogenesis protein FimT
MNRTIRHRSQTGFTVFELLIVIMIVGILAAIGTPTFKYITASNRIATELNGLVGDLQFARSEAIKQGLPVTVCISTNGTSCTTVNNWMAGWIVFIDLNSNKVVDSSDRVLRIQKPLASTDTMASSNNAVTGIVFNREGYAATGAAATVVVEIQSTPVNAQWTRCLAITAVGALTVEKSGQAVPTTCT